MKQLFPFILSLSVMSCFNGVLAQRGKDGDATITTLNTIVNTYTTMTASANAGVTSISVTNNALNGAGFAGNLAAGDLVMIIQMQGVKWENWGSSDYSININNYPASPAGWGGSATLESDYNNHDNLRHKYGKVEKYGDAGNYELREVLSVSGTNQINFTCPLEKNYWAPEGHVQVIRIPRYNNLIIQTSASIVSPDWDGDSGGVVSVEVNGNLTVNAVGGINVSGKGFRGGAVGAQSETGNNTPHSSGAGNGDSYLGTNLAAKGGAIGESIFGFTPEYSSRYIPYGTGAIANGGGGGGVQNSGGGGGSNVGDTTGHTGKGIPPRGTGNIYDAYWNAEKPNMATTISGGGGRGGYSYANTDYGVSNGPNRSGWGGNARKENGGLGGHALLYNPAKIFAGGGGGAGGQDSGQGGSGGNGGGIVHLVVYGTISGNGTIEANGGNGQNSNPTNTPTAFLPTSARRKGNDGAGGGGGGGYIYIKNTNPIPASVSLLANGGAGGSHALLREPSYGGDRELCGPGAGGAGGGIAYTSGTPVTSVAGGLPGGTTDNGSQNTWSSAFPMNGATAGGNGLTNLAAPTFDIIVSNDTICGSQSTTLTASITGTFPSGSTIGWYTMPFGGSTVATGTTFNTPVLTSTTTYYVGNCPGTFRKPVTVVVGSTPAISGTPVITDATCTTGGSVTGLTVSGGTGLLTYSWNGTTTSGIDLSNASAGSYTLVVADENGCTAQSGPHVINGVGGPSIGGNPVITAETCTDDGTITGLTVTSVAAILSYEWNGIAATDQNLSAPAGSYTLVVTDENGCTAQSGPHEIGTVPVPSITGTAVITNENCNNGGTITGLSATGGSTPYSYSWNGVSSATADLANAATGAYTLTVTDDNGCVVQSNTYQIGTDSSPAIGGTAVITNATCIAGGSITGLTVSGGAGSYTYQWNAVTTPTIDLANATPGTYTLIVTDANGCTDTSSVLTVGSTGMPVITGTPVITNVTCASQGTLTGLTVSGGTAPYVYVWNTTPSLTPDLTNAVADDYTLTVTDNAGCSVQSGPHTILEETQPVLGGTPVIADATCNGGGSITGITVSGGSVPYTYAWNGTVSAGTDLVDASAGVYTLTVTDANGCVLTSGPHTIDSDNIPVIAGTATVTGATCLVGGSISGLSVTGGAAPYTYLWNGETSTTIDVSDLDPGDYTLVVEDANGCTVTSTLYTVTAPSMPVIGGTPVVMNANCLEGGSITGITVSGGSAPYTYSWNGGLYNTLNISNLTAGIYTLTVTDANGCSQTAAPVIITEDVFVDARFSYAPDPVSVNDVVQFHDESTGNIIGWNWQIDTVNTTTQHPDYVFDKDGFYTVKLTVVDANGCIDSAVVTIEVLSDLQTPNVITANGDGINDFFILKGLVPNTRLIIVNRWGNLIYKNDNYDNTWSGKDMSGRQVTEGVYTYMVTPPDGNQKHGFVHVVYSP